MSIARVNGKLGARSQAGLSMLELMTALIIAALIVGSVVAGLGVIRRTNQLSSENLTSSNSAFLTSGQFSDDVASVGPVSGVSDLVAAGATGCGGSTSALRLMGLTADGSAVQVRSYHVNAVGDRTELRRRTCTGTSLGTATSSSTFSNSLLVRDLATGPAPVSITCDGGDPVTPHCHVVEMRVETATGRDFDLRGTIASVMNPSPTTSIAPAVAPPSGKCTLVATETTWGGTGGVAGSGDGRSGDVRMYTYDDTNQRNSYLRFDLTKPCIGANDTWPSLPGGRNLTGATLQLNYTGKSSTTCWFLGDIAGVSREGQVLQPLSGTANWTEATLTGANMPTSVYGDNTYKVTFDTEYKFTTGEVKNPPLVKQLSQTGIIEAVKKWYTAGVWTNNGWILRRSSVGDTCSVSNMFASRHDSNAARRPQLIIKWGP